MRVQVHLRAEKLGNIARGRWRGKKSNPYAVVSLPNELGPNASASGEVELGKTEVRGDNLSPQWTTIFYVDHDADRAWTPLKIAIYDSRKSAEKRMNPNRRRSDSVRSTELAALPVPRTFGLPSLYNTGDPPMGEINLEVGEVLQMEGQEAKLELDTGGYLFVHITESIDEQSRRKSEDPASGNFSCHIRGLDLENIEKGFLGLGAIDPYFELSKKYVDPRSGVVRWHVVYRSEHKPDIINPYWHPFCIDVEKLCHGDMDRELKLSVWDHQRGAMKNRWLGECIVSANILRQSVTKGGNASREWALSILDEEKEEKGLVVVLKADVV
ncbi:hypothetical protein ACHAXT_009466 [Thalassiosira profunda]